MGAWGIGLYSNDFALDLRETVKGVARLPFEPEKLLELLCSQDPKTANEAADEDHTMFWLVVADQFARRGIDCPRARNRALEIIADGTDLKTMAALGMDEKDLVRRRKTLEGVRGRIAAPIERARPRAVLKAPQKLLLEVGEVLIYPVCQRDPINPYAVGKEWAWVKAWQQDGWGALVVVERGHVFDFLAWYTPLVICEPLPVEPTLADLAEPRLWLLRHPGTLSARHYTNMRLKSLGRVSIDATKLAHFFPQRASALDSAVSDISIANGMSVQGTGISREKRIELGYPAPEINGMADIVDIAGTDGWPGSVEPQYPELSGLWQGIFSYQNAEKAPGSFSASLSERNGQLAGEIHDETDAAPAARPTLATVEGGRVGRDVRFLKRYVSSSKKYVPIQYIGETNDDATEITGQWFLPGHSSGRFVMTRPKPPTTRPAED
jgi:hypothetical protein